MNKQIVIIIGVIVVGVIAVVWLSSNSDQVSLGENESAIPEDDAMDFTLSYYNEWLNAVLSTTTDPVTAGLANDARLHEDVQAYLAEYDYSNELDPVLCQTAAPNRVGAKASYVMDREAQFLILARGLEEKSSRQAVVDIAAQDGKWVISTITCTEGESAPEREFTFEREGFLLKSVPPPLDPEYWHLVFEERGVAGHTAPLFFNESSICVSIKGEESVCDPDAFVEAEAVLIKGQMTEAGVDVVRIEFIGT